MYLLCQALFWNIFYVHLFFYNKNVLKMNFHSPSRPNFYRYLPYSTISLHQENASILQAQKTGSRINTGFPLFLLLISTLHYPVFCKNDLAATKSVRSIVSLFITHFRRHYCYCYRILYLDVSRLFWYKNHYIYV